MGLIGAMIRGPTTEYPTWLVLFGMSGVWMCGFCCGIWYSAYIARKKRRRHSR